MMNKGCSWIDDSDVPDFTFPNPAGAEFENLVQHKTTPELE